MPDRDAEPERRPDELLLAVDPGRDKCGIALLEGSGRIHHRAVVPRGELEGQLVRIRDRDRPDRVIMGRGTGGRDVMAVLRTVFPDHPVEAVDETDSTMEARRLYFADHPPRGIWRLVPLGLQLPPVPIDDYAAVILGRRYLGR